MTEQDTPKMTHDEMIDTLKGLVFGTFDRTTTKEREALDMAISALSEDVRIHARWEDGHCSNCHVFIPDDLKTILRDYCDNDFCPNCGADMRGE